MVVGVITRESIHKVCRISQSIIAYLQSVYSALWTLRMHWHNTYIHTAKEHSRRLEGGRGGLRVVGIVT